jgi:hypothetical protein
MSTDRVTTSAETVPTCWTELDEQFFTLVGDVLSANFLWGAATMLASYDVDTDTAEVAPAGDDRTRESRSGAGLPRQRGLNGWTVDPQGRTRYGAA